MKPRFVLSGFGDACLDYEMTDEVSQVLFRIFMTIATAFSSRQDLEEIKFVISDQDCEPIDAFAISFKDVKETKKND